jgi:hypothetical protein
LVVKYRLPSLYKTKRTGRVDSQQASRYNTQMDKQPRITVSFPSMYVVHFSTGVWGSVDQLQITIPVFSSDRKKLADAFERCLESLKAPVPRYTVSDIQPGDYIEYREFNCPVVLNYGPVKVPSNFDGCEILSIKRLFEVRPL